MIVVLGAVFTSCINSKSITYFNNLPDSLSTGLKSIEIPAQKIQVNDLLAVRIGGDNEKTVAYINEYFGTGVTGSSGNVLQCIVDAAGNIELPKIGKMKVAGFTRDEAAAAISKAYSEYIIGAIASVLDRKPIVVRSIAAEANGQRAAVEIQKLHIRDHSRAGNEYGNRIFPVSHRRRASDAAEPNIRNVHRKHLLGE